MTGKCGRCQRVKTLCKGFCRRCYGRQAKRRQRLAGVNTRVHACACVNGHARHSYTARGICVRCKQAEPGWMPAV